MSSPDYYHYEAGHSNWARTVADIRSGLKRWRLWSSMALRHFMGQYKGALIGPLWITVTTAMTASGLGLLYAQLFGRNIDEHLPYVTIALVVWAYMNTFATSGTAVFNANAHIFKEYPLPLSMFPMRLVVIQMVNFAFRFLVLVGVMVIFSVPVTLTSLWAIPGFLLITWIGFWASLALGVINARFRDFGQLVSAVFGFAFFITPIFWTTDRLGPYEFIVHYNPLYHMVQVVRGPLLGMGDLPVHFAVVSGIAVLSTVIGLAVYGRFSHRLPYWC
ncbi:MAG: ABC transporter permease [Pseudomonadota bacterium]